MKHFLCGKKELIRRHPLAACFILSLLLTTGIELLSRRSFISLCIFVGTKPHLFLFNICIVFWSFSLLLLVKKKPFFAAVLSIFWLLLGFIDFILLYFRVTPFNGADIRLTRDAVAVAGKYVKWWHIVLAVLAAGLLVIWLARFYKRLPKTDKKPQYLRGVLMVVISLLAVFGCNSIAVRSGVIEEQFGNLAQAYQDYGFVYCFANSLLNTGISKPEDYSEEDVVEITEDESVPEEEVETLLIDEEGPAVIDELGIEITEQTPNIIFLQLESFSDPAKYLHMECSEDPIPNYHELMKQYSSGYLSVPAVGAGTANTEFEVITGMNLDFFGPGEYPYKTVLQKEVCESICFNMKDIGYHAHAIHNNSGTFYDRYIVFEQLGFDTFTPLEYMSGYDTTYMGWAKDEILVEQIGKVLDSTRGADLIYTISVQGHGSYPDGKVLTDPEINVSGLETEEETNMMEYYIQQIHEMDAFVADLTAYLEERGEKTVLVMYGDHLPSLDLTADKLENGDEFQTEYIIWDNLGLEKEQRDLQAYQLGAWVLAKLKIQTGTMIRYHQSWLMEDVHTAREEEEYLKNMEILEYDLLYGDQNVFDGEMPYEATKLQMGVQPVTISRVLKQGDTLYVLGWNFTESSVVCVNETQVETRFVSQNMLYVPECELDIGENEVLVSQISEDHVVLGNSDSRSLFQRE